MSERKKNIFKSAGAALLSSKGKDILIYLMFVVVAFAFWMMLSLDTEMQEDYEFPVKLVSVPDDVVIIEEVPQTINVSVKAKGVKLIKYNFGTLPTLEFDFRDFTSEDGHLYISRANIETRLRDLFGTNATIVAVRPDTIGLNFVTGAGVKVKVDVVSKLKADYQHVIFGNIECNIDSVVAYSKGNIARMLTEAKTVPFELYDLKDTTSYTVKLRPIDGVRFIPDEVTVTIPVEPLILKKQSTEVAVTHTPANQRVLTFPTKVDVSYMVPMSLYNDIYPLKPYVDFDEATNEGDSKLRVYLNQLPDVYRGVEISPDSVEYIIEQMGPTTNAKKK